jgi:hypothetical protein
MQEYRSAKLVVRYDRHLHSCRSMHARTSFCLQCLEEAMDRCKWRFAGGDHRAGQAMPVRRIDLRSAQGRVVNSDLSGVGYILLLRGRSMLCNK